MTLLSVKKGARLLANPTAYVSWMGNVGMVDERIRTLLLGRDSTQSIRYLALAVGLFVATLGLMTLQEFIDQQNASVPIEVYWQMVATVVLMIAVPAVQAYRNSGLLVSWVLGAAIPLALYVDLLPYHLGGGLGAPQGGVGAALLYGVPAGTIGFALGAGARRARERFGRT